MIQEQVIPIDFGQGIDTKTDPKAVVAGKFIRLENGAFTNPKRISKRNGYTGLGTNIANIGTMSSPQLAHSYNNELLAVDQNLLLSYSSNQDAWISKGNYTSVELNRTLISEDATSSGISDVAILNNYALYGYSDTIGVVYGSVVDLSTGDILLNQIVTSTFFSSIQLVKCVLLGGTTLSIIYQKSSGNYFARTVIFSGNGVVSFSGETAITSNAIGPFDIIETSTGAAFVYQQSSTPGITIATLSTALAVSTSTIAATIGSSSVVAISKTSNGNLWAYWTESTNDGAGNLTALTIYYAVKTSNLSAVLGRTSIVATSSPYYVSNMIAKGDSITQQTLYYGQFKSNNNGSKHEFEYSNYITITSAGVIGSATLFANGVIPFSHVFTVGSRIYAVFLYRSSDITVAINGTLGPPVQPTMFVLELTNLKSPPYVVARFASGVSDSYNGYFQTSVFSQNVASFSSTKFYFNCGLIVQENSNPSNYIGGSIGVFSYSFDFNSSNANIAKNCGQISVLNGAIMQMYDGANCTELNFNLFPEITNLTGASPFGAIADGTYNYLAIYQWIDNQGNLHQSAPSLVKSITLASGAANQVTVSITTNFLTRKPNSSISIYRTVGAGGLTGSIYYLIGTGSSDPTTNNLVTLIDLLADSSIIKNNQAYNYPASSVLENSTPPPSMIMVSHNNRLWFVDSENPNTIWYTKSTQNLIGLSPSAFMTEQIDPKYGNISGLSEMDEKLVIGKSSGFLIQSGDGVNDTGSGSTLSFPQAVPSDVGISQLKGSILTPNGLMFKSDNGIYMLTRALQVVYMGAEVEAYNSQIITAATLVPGKSQIRFLCSSGLTLVYDYIFNQWSTFTNHTGISATAWNGLYIYANSGGKIYKESPGVYLDDSTAFSLLAQTSWLALASIQGFQRVRRLIMLGDFINGNSASHNLSIAAAYDFSTTFQPAITYVFGSISASGVFQYRERLPIQKCDSISLLIQETTTGNNAEYIDLTNISFEAGIKKGVNKLGGLQSVG